MVMKRSGRASAVAAVVLAFSVTGWTQIPKALTPPQPAPTEAPASKDALGRNTPRGTVLGFLSAAHKSNFELATEYLNTRLTGTAAVALAQQFAVVLDKRFPAKLNELSDKPEGSLLNPLNPDREVVGTIPTSDGELEIALDRVNDHKAGKIWVFSEDTLVSIPKVFEELNTDEISSKLPSFLVINGIAGVPLFEWIVVLVGIPFLYGITVLLNRGLSIVIGRLRRRKTRDSSLPNPEVLSQPMRLLLIAICMALLRPRMSISLLARQFWANTCVILAISAIVWLLIRLNGRIEGFAYRRLRRRNLAGTASVLRLGRRMADVLFIFAGGFGILFHFGVNPTPALAGLGVGGIAVALAAQKTLENVIGGISIILDEVVRVGDEMKFGTVQGTVEEIGLRSTVIRTFDRTLVSVPNGEIANIHIETVSARDKFRFQRILGLSYDTTETQLRVILDNIRSFLSAHPSVEHETMRVRFIGFGAYSLDLDIWVYVYARDVPGFLEIQEGLLLTIMGIIEEAGSHPAMPSQVLYPGSDALKSSALTAVLLRNGGESAYSDHGRKEVVKTE
jgi:MscS family membrane protein